MALSQSLKNKLQTQYGPWAVVTGASSGIGLEISERLAEAGLNLLLCARRESVLQDLQQRWATTYGNEVQILVADLSTKTGVQALMTAARDLEIGLFVASAGFGTSGHFIESSILNEVNMLRVNCEALLILTHHFSQRLVERKQGGVILLSSMVAFQGVPYAAHYAATKAYVQSLAEGLAEELKSKGVDVLAAAPGPVTTNFGKRADMQMNMSLKPSEVAVPILKALGRKSTVLPGRLTKFLVYALRTVPRWGKVKIMKIVMGGMTQHQRSKA